MGPALIFYGTLAAFGLLAALSLWATCRDRDLVWIGVWLAGGWAISNVLHAVLPVTTLPGPYSLVEFMVLVAASVAWGTHRNYWALVVIGGVNILSICANIAFAATFPPNKGQIYIWELATNLCFAAECLLSITVGIFDGYRVGRFHRMPRLWGRSVATDVARAESKLP